MHDSWEALEVEALRDELSAAKDEIDELKLQLLNAEGSWELTQEPVMLTDAAAKADIYVDSGVQDEDNSLILHVQLGGRHHRIQLSDELMVKAFNEWGRAMDLRK
jgi:hypothetical protein